MNLVSVRLLLFETGIGNAVRHIAKFGFGDAALPRNGSLALGGGAASPLDMAQGFAVFANGGHAIKFKAAVMSSKVTVRTSGMGFGCSAIGRSLSLMVILPNDCTRTDTLTCGRFCAHARHSALI